jgi:hypothetical protein
MTLVALGLTRAPTVVGASRLRVKNGGTEYTLTITAAAKVTGKPLSADFTASTFFMSFFVTIGAGFLNVITSARLTYEHRDDTGICVCYKL